jgi:hypothetical protein
MAKWIEDWPWVKTAGLVGLVAFTSMLLLAAVIVLLLLFFPKLQPIPEQKWLVDEVVGVFRDAQENALWLILAAFFGIVGKRAATKADVITAQAKVAEPTKDGSKITVPLITPPTAERYGDES